MTRAPHITQASRSAANCPPGLARLGLVTKCYGADHPIRGSVPKENSDV